MHYKTLSIPVSTSNKGCINNIVIIYELISAIQFAVQTFDDMNLVKKYLLRSHPFNFK